MKLLIAALAMVTAGGAQAQDLPTGSRVIVVQGKATLRHAPDFGRISYRVSGEGATQVEALQALAANRAKVEKALVSLARVKAVEIQPSPFEITETDCAEQGNPAECLKLMKGSRFTASLDATAKVTPSERTGDAASLVAERGAEKASVSGGGLLDDAAFAREVSQKALENARSQAQTIAEAQGVHLGAVLRVVSSEVPYAYEPRFPEIKLEGTTRVEDLIGSLPQTFADPKVSFSRTVAPVEASASFTVTYAIER